uniref:Armadillo like helical domain containing 3 n=1 Tax=Salmo trutta TaxID=8032 RepID=A0A674BFB4_SALTR
LPLPPPSLVNLEYLEAKLESLDGDEVMKIKDNINSLFHHCVQALAEEHQIKVVNALQTLCALFRGVHQKNKSASGFDIINMLVGFDKAELRMKVCVVSVLQVTDNISQNTILEYVMINSIFEAILQILSDVSTRGQHGYDAVVLLALLVNYRKYESVNPYIVKLSIVDDEPTLDGMGLVVGQALTEYNSDQNLFSQCDVTNTIWNHCSNWLILTFDPSLISPRTNEAILLALYEAVHLNRNFITVLAQSHPEIDIPTTPITPVLTTPTTPLGTTPPSMDMMNSSELPLDPNLQTSNLLITFLKYSSIVMQDTKGFNTRLSLSLYHSLSLPLSISIDQYADAFLHDDNMNFRVNLHRMPMRHRKKAAEKNVPSRPLVCAVLDLMVEFIVTHMMKDFPMDLYMRCVQVIHKLICYQKKCRIRLHYTWRELWSALINLLKFLLSNETVLLAKHNIFHLALLVVNLFNMFITYGDTFLPTSNSYDELYYEIVRMHQIFDNLYCMVLRVSTNAGQWKEPASKVTHSLVNVRAIINHFNPKIESYAAVNHISQLSEDQVNTTVMDSVITKRERWGEILSFHTPITSADISRMYSQQEENTFKSNDVNVHFDL